VIEVESLTKRFGATLAVDDLTFSVEPGRITGFLGPNGAGKSTTMRALLGLVRPTAGRTAVLGRPYSELEDPVRRVGVLLETFDAPPGRTGATTCECSRSPGASRGRASTRSSRWSTWARRLAGA
jgi:ABC-2 type transport system ATP-binding protein